MVKLHGQACDSLLVHLKSCFSSLWTALQDGREGCLVRASWPHPPRQRRDSRDISHACLSMSVSPQVSELTEGWRVTFISFTPSKKYGVWKCVKTQKTFVIWMTPGPKKKNQSLRSFLLLAYAPHAPPTHLLTPAVTSTSARCSKRTARPAPCATRARRPSPPLGLPLCPPLSCYI